MTVATCPHGFCEQVPESIDFTRWRSSHCGLMDIQAARATLAQVHHVIDSTSKKDLLCPECNSTTYHHSPSCQWPL